MIHKGRETRFRKCWSVLILNKQTLENYPSIETEMEYIKTHIHTKIIHDSSNQQEPHDNFLKHFNYTCDNITLHHVNVQNTTKNKTYTYKHIEKHYGFLSLSPYDQ